MTPATTIDYHSLFTSDEITSDRITRDFAEMDAIKQSRDDSSDPFLYEVVPGIFRQTDPDMSRFSAEQLLDAELGLLDISDDKWDRFELELSRLREMAPEGTIYKVFYLLRHGEAMHNIAMAKYGSAWNPSWRHLDGDGEIVWGPGSELSEKGREQARASRPGLSVVGEGIKKIITNGCPAPEIFLCSPLVRAADTMKIAYSRLMGDKPAPVIMEGLREIHGKATCDKRHSKSYLQERYPDYKIELFSEDDELWRHDRREPEAVRMERMKKVVDDIFTNFPQRYISFTAHGKCLASLCAVLGHPHFRLAQGEVLPVVVKGTRRQ